MAHSSEDPLTGLLQQYKPRDSDSHLHVSSLTLCLSISYWIILKTCMPIIFENVNAEI